VTWYTTSVSLIGAIVGAALLVSGCAKNAPQSAQNAVAALKRLEAKVELGMSYAEYRSALVDAMGVVNVFVDSDDAKNWPLLAKPILMAAVEYGLAHDTWKFANELSTAGTGRGLDARPPYEAVQSAGLLEGFPRDSGFVDLRDGKRVTYCPDGKVVRIDRIIDIRWMRARESLQDALRQVSG
jgi:outer membrane murein-binding lipoprotein Lpp